MELATFLVVFRESLEASLIVGIILTILIRLSAARRYITHVLWSLGAALATSLVLGWSTFSILKGIAPHAKEVLEGVISIGACGVLTYMIFWMHQQAKNIRPTIEGKLEGAVSRSDYWVIITLPFLAVLREGAETVLFLQATSLQSGGGLSWVAGFIGFLTASLIGILIFVGGQRIPLKPFFNVTSFLLLFVSAGLMAYGIHELQEIGWVPSLVTHVWDINRWVNEKEGIGAFLKALFGYNGNPSLVEILAYGTYLWIAMTKLRERPKAAEQS